MNWRHYVVNEPQFDFKIKPSIISPGGKITRWRPNKYPQLPAPDTLKIDYPYIIIDNWLIRFFPLSGVKMGWLSESSVAWASQRPDRKYKTRLFQFIDEVERYAFKNWP